MKTSINHIQTTADNKIKQKKEYQRWKQDWGIIAHKQSQGKNECTWIQELWDTIKRPNLRILGVDKGAEIWTKGIRSLFDESIIGNFPNLCKV
jgi:hypothetical protein